MNFRASANSFEQLRKMELWVDGNKVAEQHHTWGPYAWFNFSDALASGPHRGVMFAADIDNHCRRPVFNFTVGGLQRAVVGWSPHLRSRQRLNRQLACAGAGRRNDYRNPLQHAALDRWSEEVHGCPAAKHSTHP